MTERVCLVTGASSGVGRAVAEGLVASGANVVILVRNPEQGRSTAAALLRRAPEARIVSIVADLSDLASVREAAAVFRDRFDRLDVLAAVAGVIRWKRELSVDGYELTFATNHLGHVLLALELERSLQAAGSARYLAVGGNIGLLNRAVLPLDDLARRERGYSPAPVAIETMLARVIWTQEAARRWSGRGIRANIFFPGLVRSRLGRGLPLPLRLAASLGGLLMPRSCPTGVRACLDPALRDVTGSYILRREVAPFTSARVGAAEADALWELSTRLVGR